MKTYFSLYKILDKFIFIISKMSQTHEEKYMYYHFIYIVIEKEMT